MNEAEKRNQRDLQGFLAEQIAANADRIAPELISYAGGSTREEILASVQSLVRKSAELVQRAIQGQVRPHDQDDPGPMFTSAVREGISDQQIPDVSQMSMEEFRAARVALGLERPKDQGIFAGVRKG